MMIPSAATAYFAGICEDLMARCIASIRLQIISGPCKLSCRMRPARLSVRVFQDFSARRMQPAHHPTGQKNHRENDEQEGRSPSDR